MAQLTGIRYAITSNGAAVWDLGTDPMRAVYSRYCNAAEHRTTEPVSSSRGPCRWSWRGRPLHFIWNTPAR